MEIKFDKNFLSDLVWDSCEEFNSTFPIVKNPFMRFYWDNTIDFKKLINTMPKHCSSPIWLGSKKMFVPCGKCESCKQARKKYWINRCKLHLHSQPVGLFITLTFDDNHLGDTSYKTVSDFIKRVRRYIDFNFHRFGIKYFGAYENGALYNRPHFHICFFGLGRDDFKAQIMKDYNIKLSRDLNYCLYNSWFAGRFWRYGFVKIEDLTIHNIGYVAGYVAKKLQEYKNPFYELIPSNYAKFYNKTCFNNLGIFMSIKHKLEELSEDKSLTPDAQKMYKDNLELLDYLDYDDCKREPYYFMSKGLGFDYLQSLEYSIVDVLAIYNSDRKDLTIEDYIASSGYFLRKFVIHEDEEYSTKQTLDFVRSLVPLSPEFQALSEWFSKMPILERVYIYKNYLQIKAKINDRKLKKLKGYK